MLEWMKANNRFPPILLLRRYVKIVARFCEDHGYLDTPLHCVTDESAMPFDVRLLPTDFPPPRRTNAMGAPCQPYVKPAVVTKTPWSCPRR